MLPRFSSTQVALLLLTLTAPVDAQRAPWVAFDLGPQALREAVPTHYYGTLAATTTHPTIGVVVALPLRTWIRPEFTLRTTLGRSLPVRSASLGLGVRPPGLSRLALHVAFARIQGSQPVVCLQAGSGGCPPYGLDRRWGFEAHASWEFAVARHYVLGPTGWWTQSVSPHGVLLTKYRGVGLGVRLGLR